MYDSSIYYGDCVCASEAGEVEDLFVTDEFEIAKLDMEAKTWERLLSLGDRSLFLGNCCTFSVLAAEYPVCTSNHIYFTDEETDHFYSKK